MNDAESINRTISDSQKTDSEKFVIIHTRLMARLCPHIYGSNIDKEE